MKRFKQHHATDNQDSNKGTDTTTNVPTLWLELPYIGTKGEQLLRVLKGKFLRCLNVNALIRTRITTTKLDMLS